MTITSTTTRLAAPGVPLVLADGRTVQVRYGMRSLMRIEDTFGGIAQMQTAISPDGTAAVFRPTVQVLAAGLMHEHDGQGRPLSDVDVLADLLDPADLQTYARTLGEALQQAFPAATASAGNPRGEMASALSPSPTGTTPSP